MRWGTGSVDFDCYMVTLEMIFDDSPDGYLKIAADRNQYGADLVSLAWTFGTVL